jgi:hypothetical protein
MLKIHTIPQLIRFSKCPSGSSRIKNSSGWSTHFSQAARASQLSGMPGGSFQLGRTSMRWLRAPHLAHFTLVRNHGTGVSGG